MAFDQLWISWIWECISSASFVVLINGRPPFFFPSERGLRQGDPLSPLLFVLVAQILSRMWLRVEATGIIRGFQAGQLSGSFTYLQYVDDTILFSADEVQQLLDVRLMLEMVHDITGLKVNYNKSHMVGINMEESALRRATHIFGFQLGKFPFSYLGLPLSPGTSCCRDWQGVIQRIPKMVAEKLDSI